MCRWLLHHYQSIKANATSKSNDIFMFVCLQKMFWRHKAAFYSLFSLFMIDQYQDLLRLRCSIDKQWYWLQERCTSSTSGNISLNRYSLKTNQLVKTTSPVVYNVDNHYISLTNSLRLNQSSLLVQHLHCYIWTSHWHI